MRALFVPLFAALSVVTSANALAAADWIEECTPVGVRKVSEQAKAWSLEFDPKAIYLCGVDDRWYNPFKYAWFCVAAKDADGKAVLVSKVTQKPGRGDCF
jgi:hypothetical protein